MSIKPVLIIKIFINTFQYKDILIYVDLIKLQQSDNWNKQII